MSKSKFGPAPARPDDVITTDAHVDPIISGSSRLIADLDGLLLELQRLRRVDDEFTELAALTVAVLVDVFECALAAGEDPPPLVWSATRWLHERGLVPATSFAHLTFRSEPERVGA